MFQFIKIVIMYFVFFIFLPGCFVRNGPLEFAKDNRPFQIDYSAIGIPFILGGHGSSVPLTKHLSLTAKHIAKYDYNDVIAYHPDCDVAVIKKDNTGKTLPRLGVVNPLEPIYTAGMGLFGRTLIGKGKYYLDVNFIDSDMFKKCLASIIDAPVQSGMSGGGAYNNKDELVGIISGISGSNFRLLDGRKIGNHRTSVIVSLVQIRPWLFKTIQSYYGESINQLSLSTLALSKDYLDN